MKKQTVAIAGMGLIGGSLGLALKSRTPHTVLGIDRNPAGRESVLAAGAADEVLPMSFEQAEHIERIREADLLILALPPKAAVDFMTEHGDKLAPQTIVTDVCGVKRWVTERLAPLCRENGLHFVGGHPMAGKEKSGFAHADAALFEGASYIFTPLPDTPPDVLQTLEEMARSIGCGDITIATPVRHDQMIAFTSQLPHVLAGAYVNSPRCADHKGFSAGSYRDVSRVAAVDENLWTELFLMNADSLCEEIDELIANLQTCRHAIAEGDASRLRAILRERRRRKESVTE